MRRPIRCVAAAAWSAPATAAPTFLRCGEPRSRDSLGYREVVGEWGKRYEVEVQEWIYGPWNGMLYFVRFEGNRLSAIQSRRGD